MKKLLCVLLIAFLLLPSAVVADDPDPIVGCWYVCLDIKDATKELQEAGYLYGIFLLVFCEDGSIMSCSSEFKSSSGTQTEPTYVGKWEKNGSEYKTSIIGNGENRAFFEDDLLYVCFLNNVQYHGLRKMTKLNLYNNIYKK